MSQTGKKHLFTCYCVKKLRILTLPVIFPSAKSVLNLYKTEKGKYKKTYNIYNIFTNKCNGLRKPYNGKILTFSLIKFHLYFMNGHEDL